MAEEDGRAGGGVEEGEVDMSAALALCDYVLAVVH